MSKFFNLKLYLIWTIGYFIIATVVSHFVRSNTIEETFSKENMIEKIVSALIMGFIFQYSVISGRRANTAK